MVRRLFALWFTSLVDRQQPVVGSGLADGILMS